MFSARKPNNGIENGGRGKGGGGRNGRRRGDRNRPAQRECRLSEGGELGGCRASMAVPLKSNKQNSEDLILHKKSDYDLKKRGGEEEHPKEGSSTGEKTGALL